VVGSIAKVFLGLLILPVSHNSVWTVSFKINRASMVRAHQWSGNVFLGLMVAHAVLMTLASKDMKYPWLMFSDDFTVSVPLSFFLSFLNHLLFMCGKLNMPLY
jgi:hypothetical protein